MIRGDLKGVKFITSNTDAQALSLSLQKLKFNLVLKQLKGLGQDLIQK
jgi:cell division GTPase FtsZ